MDLSRTYAISGGAQPVTLQFSDNLTRIRALEAKTNTAATLGVFVGRDATGEPDFLLDAKSTTTIAIESASFVVVANMTPAIADLGRVYVYVVDQPLPASQASLAGQPGMGLTDGSGPKPSGIMGQNVNALTELVDETTGGVVSWRATESGASGGIGAVSLYGISGKIRGALDGSLDPGNVGTNDLLGSAAFLQGVQPSGSDGNWSRVASDPSIENNMFGYGAQGGALHTTDGGNVAIELPVPAPPPAALGSTGGGVIAAPPYFARATRVTPLGETNAGPETSLAVAADNLLTVGSPPTMGPRGDVGQWPNDGGPRPNSDGQNTLSGYLGWNVYVSTATGTETKQNAAPIAIGNGWTEPTTGLIAGAALPAANTTFPAVTPVTAHPCRVCRVQVLAVGTSALDLYDNTSTTEGKRAGHIPASAAAGTIYNLQSRCAAGLTLAGGPNAPEILLTYFG